MVLRFFPAFQPFPDIRKPAFCTQLGLGLTQINIFDNGGKANPKIDTRDLAGGFIEGVLEEWLEQEELCQAFTRNRDPSTPSQSRFVL